ncbi:dTDP-4-dehydrorhamnose 3,5-epimerase [compost metagenome]
MVDLRLDSPTYLKWTSITLDAEQRNAIYIPAGCAHGFQTLVDDSELFYHMSEPYRPELARGVRWDDPVFAIDWPLPPQRLSQRDASYPDFEP